MNDKPTFYIYTTGIVNWASFLDINQNLIEIWKNSIRDNIVSLIPENFEINILHFDPIYTINQSGFIKRDKINENKIIDYVNQTLIPFDYTNSRVVNSTFNAIPFSEENIKNPYILIDIAHLYKYPKLSNTVELNFDQDNEYKNLYSLRFGFLGNPEAQLLGQTNLFKINSDNSVTTYVDKMIELDYPFDSIEPADFINQMYKKIILNIENFIKNIKQKPYFKVEHIFNALKINSVNLMKSIIIRIWNDLSYQRIIDELTSFNIEKNLDLIIELEPKP